MNTFMAASPLSSPAIARIVPFALYIGFLALAPLLTANLTGMEARWLYGIKISLVVLALALFVRQYSELRWQAETPPGRWLEAVGAGIVVFLLWVNLDVPALSFPMEGGFDPRDEGGGIRWDLALTRIAGAALIVPVMEELFWRSFVMRWIDNQDFLVQDPQRVPLRGILLSSILFGLEHNLWFAGILAGVTYGGLYRRSGNLWLPILAHGVTNLLLGLWVVSTGNWAFW